MNKSSLTIPVVGATGISLALATALIAALAAIFVFGAKDAGAQNTSVKISPTNIDLGDVAVGSTDTTEITLNNNGDSEVTIGGIDLGSESLEGLDLGDIRLVDTETGREFVVDTATGLLQLLDPNRGLPTVDVLGNPIFGTIDIPGTSERVIELVLTPRRCRTSQCCYPVRRRRSHDQHRGADRDRGWRSPAVHGRGDRG